MAVSIGEITKILANSAEASGLIIDIGDGVTQHGHCYGKTTNAGLTASKTVPFITSGEGSFTCRQSK